MAIEMKVGDPSSAAEQEKDKTPKVKTEIELNIRKASDGSLMIRDHIDIDIIVLPKKKKILTLVKDLFTDDVYDTQNRLFKYLTKKGVIEFDSIKAGNIYGSMEATYISEMYNDSDPIQTVVFAIGKYIEDERPYFAYSQAIQEDETERVTDPDNFTELGEVPQSPKKGNLPKDPYGYLSPYSSGSLYGRGIGGVLEEQKEKDE
jgi:hypothetical protein